MSRLDEELRMAFRREQPPVDFTDRLLEQIALQPKPRRRWWQSLADMLRPPKLKWVAIGATAALLVAIGAAQYSQLYPPAEDRNTVAVDTKAEEAGKAPVENKDVKIEAPAPKLEATPRRDTTPRVAAASNLKPRNIRAENRVANSEAEAAKEKILLALHITSAALNDAQRAIQEDASEPQPQR